MESETIIHILGNNIANQRKTIGLSQKELAGKLNITQEALVRIEKGKMAPKMSRITEIAQILNCSVAFLFRDSHDETNARAIQISKLLSLLPAEQQEATLHLLQEIVNTSKLYSKK